jgi:hypothetical protein
MSPEKTGPGGARRNAGPMQGTISVPGVARAGVIGGLAGALTFDAYMLGIFVFLAHTQTLTTFYQYVASGAIGKAAYGSPGFVWLGLAIHIAVSIGWGAGFAYVGARTPQVFARPLVSGLVFGLVVMLAMALVEFAAAIWAFPTLATFENGVIAHTLFFGIPVAYVVAREMRRA